MFTRPDRRRTPAPWSSACSTRRRRARRPDHAPASSAASTSASPSSTASPTTRGSTGRTAGGSSGGSAAAVAGGLVTIATRRRRRRLDPHPRRASTACVGMKGTAGRIPRGPEHRRSHPMTVVVGCLARSVRDVARWYDVCRRLRQPRPVLACPAIDGWERDLGTHDLPGQAGRRSSPTSGSAVVRPEVGRPGARGRRGPGPRRRARARRRRRRRCPGSASSGPWPTWPACSPSSATAGPTARTTSPSRSPSAWRCAEQVVNLDMAANGEAGPHRGQRGHGRALRPGRLRHLRHQPRRRLPGRRHAEHPGRRPARWARRTTARSPSRPTSSATRRSRSRSSTFDGLPVGMQVIGRHHEDALLLDLAARGRARAPLAARGARLPPLRRRTGGQQGHIRPGSGDGIRSRDVRPVVVSHPLGRLSAMERQLILIDDRQPDWRLDDAHPRGRAAGHRPGPGRPPQAPRRTAPSRRPPATPRDRSATPDSAARPRRRYARRHAARSSSSKPSAPPSGAATAACPPCTPPTCSAAVQSEVDRAVGHRPGRGRPGRRRLRQPGRQQSFNVARTAWLTAGLPIERRRHHRRHPVRLVAAGHQPGHRAGRGRRRRRRRRRAASRS